MTWALQLGPGPLLRPQPDRRGDFGAVQHRPSIRRAVCTARPQLIPAHADPLLYLKLAEGQGTTTTANIGSLPISPVLYNILGSSWIIGKVDYALRFNAGSTAVQSIGIGITPARVFGTGCAIVFWARALAPRVVAPQANAGTSGTGGQVAAASLDMTTDGRSGTPSRRTTTPTTRALASRSAQTASPATSTRHTTWFPLCRCSPC